MDSFTSQNLGLSPPGGEMPAAISILIDSAVATFDADRSTSRRCLIRASALLHTADLARNASREAQRARRQAGLATWQLNRVIDYIETHLAEKIAGRELASVVHLSKGHLFRAFKVSVGTSPFQYIAVRRFELASTLIRTTREPLSQIAIAAGLCDQSHLCRVFRRITGVSPAAWRRAKQGEPEQLRRPTSESAQPSAGT